ncbi:hypothetical protein VX037_18125 [Gordonia sp. Z-3]|uniref:hypothetical protein n=1 Tax=Gordonia sp. Z-3 TaxID=3115408 RepID=UPI002E2C47A6|nr:hypothetical protein [Gordonia sp. Z-3]MED5802945.1 hypothetical protein [Gordonia sp. Z-3]
MTDQIGSQVGHRNDPRGVLAFEHLPDDMQKAEDSTAVADRDNWPHRASSNWLVPPYMDRPATDTERALLAHLGYELPDELTTRVRNTGTRHRSWPQLPDTEPQGES